MALKHLKRMVFDLDLSFVGSSMCVGIDVGDDVDLKVSGRDMANRSSLVSRRADGLANRSRRKHRRQQSGDHLLHPVAGIRRSIHLPVVATRSVIGIVRSGCVGRWRWRWEEVGVEVRVILRSTGAIGLGSIWAVRVAPIRVHLHSLEQ